MWRWSIWPSGVDRSKSLSRMRCASSRAACSTIPSLARLAMRRLNATPLCCVPSMSLTSHTVTMPLRSTSRRPSTVEAVAPSTSAPCLMAVTITPSRTIVLSGSMAVAPALIIAELAAIVNMEIRNFRGAKLQIFLHPHNHNM